MSNEWHEKGEPPPIGTVVEFISDNHERNNRTCIDYWSNGDKLECLAIRKVGVSNLPVFFNMRDQTASCLLAGWYRPIKSDREKAIEEILQIVTDGDFVTFTKIADKIYDAGYRKVENKNE